MASSKGMSQTLALIVAASVLMMTALTVIFMVQGGLQSVGTGTSSSSCSGTVEAQCATLSSSSSIDSPPPCYDEQGNVIPDAPSYVPDTQGDAIQCSAVS